MRVLDVVAENIRFNFSIREGITLVVGDSGTGKTFLFNTLQKGKVLGQHKDVFLLNYLDQKNKPIGDYLEQRNLVGTLIIIDNADVLLTDEDKNYILLDQATNTYLLFGRKAENLNLTVKNIAQIERHGSLCSLRYTR